MVINMGLFKIAANKSTAREVAAALLFHQNLFDIQQKQLQLFAGVFISSNIEDLKTIKSANDAHFSEAENS